MVVTHDPRPPYREAPRDAYLPPSRNMPDTRIGVLDGGGCGPCCGASDLAGLIHAGSVASAYGFGRDAFRRNAAHNTAAARASNKARANSVAEPEPSPGAPRLAQRAPARRPSLEQWAERAPGAGPGVLAAAMGPQPT